jgi:hypothetical protein
MAEIEQSPLMGHTSRRGFMAIGGAAAAAGALMFGDWTPARAADAVLPKRTLGRTGLQVTCLAYGGIQLTDASSRAALEHAIDRGVNYVHTCPGYTGGKSIQVVGEVMRTRRDKVYLALKTDPHDVDRCLKILNTDHVDVLIPDTWGINRSGRDPEGADEKAKYDALKQAGKIRFAGFATHNDQVDRLTAAYKGGWRDVVLIAKYLSNQQAFEPLYEAAAKSGMGIMAMKVASGPQATFAEKIRVHLKNPNIACVTPGMNSIDQIDQNIATVCATIAELRHGGGQVAAATGAVHGECTLCGDCVKVCAPGVALLDYLRADLYRDRGDVRLAQDLVRAIPARNSLAACTHCGHCNHTCQHGVDVVGVMEHLARA